MPDPTASPDVPASRGFHRLAGCLLLIFSTAATQAVPASFRYYRFTPTRLRDAGANSVQLSEFEFYLGATRAAAPTVSNPGGDNPASETAPNTVDGDLDTKWLDFNKGPLVFDFGAAESVDGYRWATANDATERDPLRWTLEGSDDNLNWALLDDQTGADYPTAVERLTFTPTLGLNQTPDEPLIRFTASDGTVTSDAAIGVAGGTLVTLEWDVIDSTGVTLDAGSGPQPVAATGSTSELPVSTQSYTLAATNAAGSSSATVTVFVGVPVLPPVINEFMADGTRDGALLDEDGNASDWLELHNPNGFAISVGGYHLSDDALLPARWQIPAGTMIGPADFLVIFASGKNRAIAGSELHANFSIEKAGEYLGLTAPDGFSVTDRYAPVFPPQFEDVSYGRVPPVAGDTFNYFVAPTPGFANDTAPGPPGEKVVFVTPAQTFSGSVAVELSVVSPTAVIRYTTDGSLPDETSAIYSSPIVLNASALVRARAYDAGFAPGEVTAEAYIEIEPGLAAQTSDLPVVILENFGGGAVPNDRVLQAAYLTLHEPDVATGRTDLTALPVDANRAGIKRRGSSTLNDPKGNYRIEFWQDGSEEDKNINLLGMSDHDEWILFAPYTFDRSLVRIPFIHDLSNAIGAYAPKGRFCEVYLNTGGGAVSPGDYQGVYVLQERISRDGDRVDVERLDTNDLVEPDVTGGYILSIDRPDPEDQGFRSALGHPEDPAIAGPQPWFNYVYPKEQNILPQQADYIRGYIDDLEAALYGPGFKDPLLGYQAWLDCEAAIDHHILVTFTKDPDALRLSTYLYKPRGGRLAFGPIWDFDRTMGCDADDRSADPTGWDPPYETAQFFQYDYWGRLFEDPDFWQKWIDRWQALRAGEFGNSSLRARVDGLAAEVSEAQVRDTARWPEVAPDGGPLSALGGWDGELDHLKNWLTQRADWIDTQFTPPPILQAGGPVAAGTTVSAMPQQGTMYYTLDGTDPRLPGGGINPGAIAIGGGGTVDVTLVSETASVVEALRPTGPSPGPTAWTVAGFDAGTWQTGTFGVGYDEDPTYAPLINIDVGNAAGSQPTSAYIRVPFQIADPSSLTSLTLRVKYDDGFIAYLNGSWVEARNAPGAPAWNSGATASHSDLAAMNFIDFDLGAHLDKLDAGDNVLAIHALNRGTANSTNTGSTSGDMLLSAELLASRPAAGPGIRIDATTGVTARALDGTDWSGPVSSTFIVGAAASPANLVISEIMYHPPGPTPAEISAGFSDAGDFEFLEVQNVSGQAIDLAGVMIAEAFDFDFNGGAFTLLAPGGVALVVRNQGAFEARYGSGGPIVGEWGDPAAPDGGSQLSNGGERVLVVGAGGGTILDFVYDDGSGWPQGADGGGSSLVLNEPYSVPDHGVGANWHDSLSPLGTPGVGHADLYDEWSALHFTAAQLADPEVSGPGADPDRDRLPNLLELALCGDPWAASTGADLRGSIQSIDVDSQVDDYFTITFVRPRSLPGIAAVAEFSHDLVDWSTEGVLVSATDNLDGTETVVYRDTVPATGARCFGRVSVSK